MWIAVTVVTAFGLGFAVARLAAGGFRREKKPAAWGVSYPVTVECAINPRQATLATLRNEKSGRHCEVVSCSELTGDITCDRGCLVGLNAKPRER